MPRTTLNFIVDLISAVVGLGLVVTGLVMYFALPPGSRQMSLWGLGRHDWGDIHSYLALSVVVLMLVHLALHWSWVCTYVRRAATRNPQAAVPRTGSIYGIVLAVLIAGLLTGFAFYSRARVEQVRGAGRQAAEREAKVNEAGLDAAAVHAGRGGAGRGEVGQPAINGSITLAEAARLSNQTPAQLKQKLGLPAGTSEQMRLREVMESKGWSMSELRGRITADAEP